MRWAILAGIGLVGCAVLGLGLWAIRADDDRRLGHTDPGQESEQARLAREAAQRRALERARAHDEAVRLAAQGRFEEALERAPRGDGSAVLTMAAAEAERAGDHTKVLALYRAWLDYFPFEPLDWHSRWTTWDEMAAEYLDLVRRRGAEADRLRAAPDLAALAEYQRLARAHEADDLAAVEAAAQQILQAHPKSRFAAAAVLSVACLVSQQRGYEQTAAVYEKYLARMRAAGVADRGLVLVLIAYVESSEWKDGGRPALAAYCEIADRTAVARERRHAWLQAARLALGLADAASLEQCRALCRSVLADAPADAEADEARRFLVQTYLADRRPQEALAALRALEQEAPGADVSAILFEVSRGYYVAEDLETSLALLREAVERFPRGAAAPLCYVGMGEVYGKLGREEDMVAAYRTAALLPAVDTNTELMDASNTRNRAYVFLGRYYMDKQNWAEALKWWEAWNPTSWCGTCLMSMEEQRKNNIAKCRDALGRPRPYGG